MYSNVHNERGLNEIDRIQAETKARLDNTMRTLEATNEVGSKVSEELVRQGEQLKNIREDVSGLNDKLDKSHSLLNTFDRWAFRRTNQAKLNEETKQELARNQLSSAPREQRIVYEQQRYDPMTRTWKECFLPTDPPAFVHQDGTSAIGSLDTAEGDNRWKIDFAEREIDAEGWSYGFDFAAFKTSRNTSKPKWNDFVRRRKWKYDPFKPSDVVSTVAEKYGNRGSSPEAAAAKTAGPHYTPRRAAAEADPALTFTLMGGGKRGVDTSYTSAQGWESMTDHETSRLRRTEQVDREIDGQIDQIGRMVDAIGTHARAINTEVKSQNRTIADVDKGLDDATLKVATVNKRVQKNLR